MRVIIAVTLLAGLAACNAPTTATFACINGPNIAITTADDTATLTFADGRTEVLPADPSREGVFAKPGVVWVSTAFRSGRLIDGSNSYGCDQSSV